MKQRLANAIGYVVLASLLILLSSATGETLHFEDDDTPAVEMQVSP